MPDNIRRKQQTLHSAGATPRVKNVHTNVTGMHNNSKKTRKNAGALAYVIFLLYLCGRFYFGVLCAYMYASETKEP